jgi:hypothetical protein
VAHWVVAYGDVEATFARAAPRIADISDEQRRRPLDRGTRRGRTLRPAGEPADGLGPTQMPHKAKRVLVDALGLTESECA